MWIADAIFDRKILVYNLNITMNKATITSIGKATLQEDGSEFLDVCFEISNEDGVLAVRRLGFPLDTSKEIVEEEVRKALDTFTADATYAEAHKEHDAAHAKADETIEALVGAEIASE